MNSSEEEEGFGGGETAAAFYQFGISNWIFRKELKNKEFGVEREYSSRWRKEYIWTFIDWATLVALIGPSEIIFPHMD